MLKIYDDPDKQLVVGLVAGLVLILMIHGIVIAANDPIDTFKRRCASCHGLNGKGMEKIVKKNKVKPEDMDLTAPAVVKMGDEAIAKIISNGKGKMLPFGKKLSKDEVAGLVKYIRTLSVPAAEKKK